MIRPITMRPRDVGGVAVAAILVLYAALVLLRMPEIVLKGRFWAEEGTVFFTNAWTLDPMTALLMPVGGYLNIVANGATLLARWAVPLADAPYVSIAIGLLFQLVPPAILLTARDAWLQGWPVRLCAAALLLFVPGADEIWLQTLHCQFELALACGLILALDVPQDRRQVGYLAILVLAPLCGPGAIALTPLLALRAAIDRSTGRTMQLAALVGGSAMQMLCFFKLGSGRGYTLDPAILLAVVTAKNLMIPFIGLRSSTRGVEALYRAAASGHVPLAAIMAPLVVFGGMLAAIWHTGCRPAFWLLAAAAAAALASYIGALDGTVLMIDVRAGARYAVVPLSLTALTFLAIGANGDAWLRWPARGICLWLLMVGMRNYTAPWPPVRDGPVWRDQVALWQAEPSRALEIWPKPWTVRLEPK
ncbi:MAG: hypothetical protein ACRYG8_27475 [Janthinobacterium lividum]